MGDRTTQIEVMSRTKTCPSWHRQDRGSKGSTKVSCNVLCHPRVAQHTIFLHLAEEVIISSSSLRKTIQISVQDILDVAFTSLGKARKREPRCSAKNHEAKVHNPYDSFHNTQQSGRLGLVDKALQRTSVEIDLPCE